jgi:hypothetical protein
MENPVLNQGFYQINCKEHQKVSGKKSNMLPSYKDKNNIRIPHVGTAGVTSWSLAIGQILPGTITNLLLNDE